MRHQDLGDGNHEVPRSMESAVKRDRRLLACLVAYALASLLHFAHNATHLREYPNMPPWLNARIVWLAWLVITTVGVIGYWLYHHVSRWIGSPTIAVYALLGYGGLDHYAIAPVGAHSIQMHATIAAEVVTATMLLIVIGSRGGIRPGADRRGVRRRGRPR